MEERKEIGKKVKENPPDKEKTQEIRCSWNCEIKENNVKKLNNESAQVAFDAGKVKESFNSSEVQSMKKPRACSIAGEGG